MDNLQTKWGALFFRTLLDARYKKNIKQAWSEQVFPLKKIWNIPGVSELITVFGLLDHDAAEG